MLIKEPKKNKLSTNFGTGEFTMTERKGNTVTVESQEGKKYKRNLTEVRKIIDFDEEGEEEMVEGETETGEGVEVQGKSEIDRETEAVEINDPGRPKRHRKVPERYGV